MLDRNSHQGLFGEEYVRALATAAGLVTQVPNLDHTGVDLRLCFPGAGGGTRYPSIEVQVKTWSRPRSSGGLYQFEGLSQRQFNQLAGTGFQVPRYLFVVVTPRDPRDWIVYRSDGLLFRQLVFYRSLEDELEIDEPSPTRHVRVEIPQGNVLTVQTLLGLLDGGVTVRMGRAV